MRILEQLTVADSSSIGEGRRLAIRLAEGIGFDEGVKGKIAIVISELVTNLIKYASGGELVLESQSSPDYAVLHIYAYDQGPGMENVTLCMQDGYSSSGTVGGGLGAISRLPHVFDIYSRPGKGTAVYCAFHTGQRPENEPMEWAGLNFNYPGELVSGDGYAHFDSANFSTVIVVDGLGHGTYANEAATLAIKTFESHVELMPAQIIEKIHNALTRTRGAAVAVARINHQTNELSYSGLGNISAQIAMDFKVQSLLSNDGIVGGNARRFHTNTYPWSSEAILTMFTDGLTSKLRLDVDTYPGFVLRSPNIIASVLMRDFKRGRDDATVVVAKARGVKNKSW
jgi:anti-sigma regulatory factor (Ser/Thr protein kinase)